MGEEMLAAAWGTLNSPDWKLEKQLDNGDRVQVKQVNGKKVFKLTVSRNTIFQLFLRALFSGLCRYIPQAAARGAVLQNRTGASMEPHTDRLQANPANRRAH